MKKKFFIMLSFFLVFFLGFLTSRIYRQIKTNREPLFLKWGYDANGNIGWYTLDDKNGLIIMGNYNSEGLESFSIYDDKKDYHQYTVFGKTYDGPIEQPDPPEYDEVIEVNSFLVRSEIINNKELRYYIENSDDPKIIIQK